MYLLRGSLKGIHLFSSKSFQLLAQIHYFVSYTRRISTQTAFFKQEKCHCMFVQRRPRKTTRSEKQRKPIKNKYFVFAFSNSNRSKYSSVLYKSSYKSCGYFLAVCRRPPRQCRAVKLDISFRGAKEQNARWCWWLLMPFHFLYFPKSIKSKSFVPPELRETTADSLNTA